MLEEERSAWEDAYRESLIPVASAPEREPGWPLTAGIVAAGFIALWALHGWVSA